MTDKEIKSLIESRWNDWKYGSSTEAKYKAEECKDILELIEESQVKESAKTQHIDETCKENGNSLTQEHVSESIDFEQELYKAFGQIKDFTLGIAIAKKFYDMGRKHNEPVSEALEDAASSFARKDSEGISNPANFYYTIADKARIFKAGAEWQKANLMANATEVTVHIDAGGYPYIPQIELYDYDKDIPLAKEGDKYRVVLIKEN